MPFVVEVLGLSKRYATAFSKQSVQALDAVDLQIEPGEIFGRLGPNGAGKTTLVKILLNIVQPTAGQAALFTIPVLKPQARKRVGYLPENHRFPDFLTAEQVLELYGQMAHVSAHDRRQRIPLLLETVRMTEWLDVKIKKFSKGMMQRLGLAQALLSDADLIFLDEPTDGVDPVGRREIRDLLVELRDQGKTIFLNSHLLSEVEQVCTRVAILNQGRLIREGSIESLTMSEPVYEVLSTPIPEALLTAFAGAIDPLDEMPQDPDLRRYQIKASDRLALNTMLDRLRSEAVLLEAVHPIRQSLEDYFIEVVQDGG